MEPQKKYVRTAEFAEALGVKTRTVHRSHSKKGHYQGFKPIKAPNGYLWWPADAFERVFGVRESVEE
ncbi:uncharacterized protein Dvar_11540 [Desulfosarcina variabilis str. Montpellier]|uniref:hypothetical protein n=1 Tax=Desulfosarcina variabilis TaxID=2300 RepID=UPI003AFAFA19